jgi:DNA-binding transcriptional MerR regulator
LTDTSKTCYYDKDKDSYKYGVIVKRKEKFLNEGYIRSELVDLLRTRGLTSSGEQLRQYEAARFFEPKKTAANYRIYTPEVVQRVCEVYVLKCAGFPLKKIKKFLDLEKRILESKLLNKGPDGFKALPPIDVIQENKSNQIAYERFFADVENYIAMCEEARGQLKRLAYSIEEGKAGIVKKEEAIRKMGGAQ